MMKCKVRLTRMVEMFVEGKDEDAIMDWLRQTTPEEAFRLADGHVNDDFDVCSEKCLKEKFDQYCSLSSDNSRYEIGVESRLFKRKA